MKKIKDNVTEIKRRSSNAMQSAQDLAVSASKKMAELADKISKMIKDIQPKFDEFKKSLKKAKGPKAEEQVWGQAEQFTITSFTGALEQSGRELPTEEVKRLSRQISTSFHNSVSAKESGLENIKAKLENALQRIKEGEQLENLWGEDEEESSEQGVPPPPPIPTVKKPESIRVSSQPSTKAQAAQQERAPALPPKPPIPSMTAQLAKPAAPAVPSRRPPINNHVSTAPVIPVRPASVKPVIPTRPASTKVEKVETDADKKKRILMASLGITEAQFTEMQNLKTGAEIKAGQKLTEVEKRKSVGKQGDSKVSADALLTQLSRLKETKPVEKKATKTISGFNLDMLKKAQAPDDEDPNNGSPKGGGKSRRNSWGD